MVQAIDIYKIVNNNAIQSPYHASLRALSRVRVIVINFKNIVKQQIVIWYYYMTCKLCI